jgi:hypothetical protein
MRLDSYAIRRSIEDFRYRAKSAAGDANVRSLKIAGLCVICLLCLLWLGWRAVPERTSVTLTTQQSFLVTANQAMLEDAGEDTQRFALVTIVEEESAGFRIFGEVRSQQDLEHLRQRLTALNPPAALNWEVTIGR